MFLDESYFQGELYLPNLKFRECAVGMAVADQVEGEKDLHYFIKKYEVGYLHKLLGDDLAKAFIEGVENGDPVWDKLYDLLYFQEMSISISPAANYVYWHIRRSGRTQTTMFGEVRHKADHSEVVSDRPKMVNIWNDMVRQNRSIYSHLRSNWDAYKPYGRHCACVCPELFEMINIFGV